MARIPLARRSSTGFSIPQIEEPQVTMPSEAAMGADVQRAKAQTAEVVGKVANLFAEHIVKRQQEKNDAVVLSRETAFRQALQDRLNSKEEETITVNGQEVKRPKGYLNRQLWQAEGVTEQFDAEYLKGVRQQYTVDLNDYQKSKLIPAMDTHYQSVRGQIISHEARQRDEDLKATTEANVAQKVNDYSALVKTPEDMQVAIADIVASRATYDSRYSPEVREQKKRETVDKFVSDVAKWNIYTDPATQEEQSAVLQALKDPKGIYKDLSQDAKIKVVEESQRRVFQNNQTFKRDVEESQGQRNDDIIKDFVAGNVDLRRIDDEMLIPEEQGGIKKQTLLTYQKALQSGITKELNRMLTEKTPDKDPTIRATKVNQYLDLIDSFVDDKTDMWAAREQLAKAYADGIINPKEQQFLNTLKKNLKTIEQNRSSGPIVNIIKAVKVKMGQFNATDEEVAISLKQLLGTATPNEQMMQQILSDHVKAKIPGVATFAKEGQVFFDKDGNQFTIYPDGRVE